MSSVTDPAPSIVIDKLYSKYFQKSRNFLYPLLEIPKNSEFIPTSSFVAWTNSSHTVHVTDDKLLVRYVIPEDRKKEWLAFSNKYLLKNKHFYEMYLLEDDSILIIYDLRWYNEDLKHFRSGKYSRMSEYIKARIREYHGIGSAEWAYIETFLEPEKHFATYAELLDVDEELLRATGELCEAYNIQKETLAIDIKPSTPITALKASM